MADDGETKDDVKVPDGEVGEKIDKLFTTEEKDTSRFEIKPYILRRAVLIKLTLQTLLSLQLWVSRLLLKPRRLLAVRVLLQGNTSSTLTFLMALTFVCCYIYSNHTRL